MPRIDRKAWLGGLLAVAACAALCTFSVELQHLYQQVVGWRNAHTAVFVGSFFALFILAALTSVFPASILGVAAGAAFGLPLGFALSALALVIAAVIAFVAARYFFREVSRQLLSRFVDLEALETRLRRHGWRYAMFIRLAPLAPFGITSYCMGLTPLALGQYVITTVGTFPFLFACVYLGSVGRIVQNGASGDTLLKLAALLTLGAVALAIAVRLLPSMLKRWLNPTA